MISVITVVFNGERYLEETIQSVINQTYPNVEYIIIDGGSTDGTLDIIKKYEDKIDYWVSEKDKGIYDAMNKGIRVAVGEWINFINAGDTFLDQGVLSRVFERDVSKFDVVYGDMTSVYEDLNLNVYRKIKDINKALSLKEAFKTIYSICHQSVFIKKIICTYFDTNFNIASDRFYLLNLYFQSRKFHYVNECICKYLIGGFSGKKFFHSYKERLKTLLPFRNYFTLWQNIELAVELLKPLLKWHLGKKLPKSIVKQYLTYRHSKIGISNFK
ncbi:MAG: glycosyltransferase [Candidatus Omnitrophica bacterium]|nr:glycosyltransferase [Candidatus Omnitrophota bacterium]